MSVTDSQKDLVSVATVSNSPSGTISSLWTKHSTTERKLVGGLVVALLVCLGLVVALIVISTTSVNTGGQHDQNVEQAALVAESEVCMTQGCVGMYQQAYFIK